MRPFTNIEQAQQKAFDGLNDGDLDISINIDGSLHKISLPKNRDIEIVDIAAYRKAADSYISFINGTNVQLRNMLLRDGLLFYVLSWTTITLFSLCFLLLLSIRLQAGSTLQVLDYVHAINANSFNAYLQLPMEPIDPLPGISIDKIASVPYSVVTKFLLSGLALFALKFFLLLNPKFIYTRRVLLHHKKLSDADLLIELRKTRKLRDTGTEQPWNMAVKN